MKSLLIALTLSLLLISTSQAEQKQVVRLHVTGGLFNINQPIGTGGSLESQIGPFTLETGIYQGKPVNGSGEYLVTWNFGFFGPVSNYTAANNITYPQDAGGPPPSGIVDDEANTILMDMSSWFAYWNGTDFNQGSNMATGSYDPATGAFTLNWNKLIMSGPFYGTTGYWQLSGFVEVTDGTSFFIPVISVDNGITHECNQHGGSSINAHLTINGPDNLVISNVQWYLDNQPIASNTYDLNYLVPLGNHTLKVDVTSNEDITRTTSYPLSVNDTQKPSLKVGFVDSRSGEFVTSIESNAINWIKTYMVASDACDPVPSVNNGSAGFNINHGETLKIQGNNGTIELTVDEITIRAIANDAAGHYISDFETLTIVP